jgi:hypothetical protein
MLGRVGIPVNIKERQEVRRKGRKKIRIKMNLCGQNVLTQINGAKREEKWQDRKMDSTEKLLLTKDAQQLLYRGIQKTGSRKHGIKWTKGVSERCFFGGWRGD